MIKKTILLLAVSIVAVQVLFLGSCTKKSPVYTVIVIHDTLTTGSLKKLTPDSLSNDRIVRLALQMALYQNANITYDSSHHTLAHELAQQLLLRTNTEWSDSGAFYLYGAADKVALLMKTDSSALPIQTYCDSLMKAAVVFARPVTVPTFSSDTTVQKVLSKLVPSQRLARMLKSLFDLSDDVAEIVADFVTTEQGTGPKNSLEQSIKGLLFDAKAQSASRSTKSSEIKSNNSAQALAFRSQKSVQDSIGRHIRVLEAMYKKTLKIYPNMQGVVWVTFIVAPTGSVSEVSIKRSDIKQAEFTTPFKDYLKGILFKPIPDDIGTMTFDFPFEFSPQN